MAVAFSAALGLSGCGGGEDRKAPEIDAFSPVEQRVGTPVGPPRASPRWEQVFQVFVGCAGAAAAAGRLGVGEA